MLCGRDTGSHVVRPRRDHRVSEVLLDRASASAHVDKQRIATLVSFSRSPPRFLLALYLCVCVCVCVFVCVCVRARACVYVCSVV